VFLRILDYYTGILFLTTNRAGALDEAFKSRIHYKIYYPPLSKEQTLEIWEINIQRLRRIEENQSKQEIRQPIEIQDAKILRFAEYQFNAISKCRGAAQWNGRQIRNAFQVARSLAYSDAATEADRIKKSGSGETIPAPKLDVRHFELMHHITESFNEYMLEVHSGYNDSQLAAEAEHRADHWTQSWTLQSHEYEKHSNDYYGEKEASIDAGGPSQGPAGRPRSGSHRMSGPNLAIPGVSQRYSNWRALSPIAVYDEPSGNGPSPSQIRSHSPNSGQHRPHAQQHAGPAIRFRGPSPGEGGELDRQVSPAASPMFNSTVGWAEMSPPGRSSADYTHRRDSQRQGYFEADPAYGDVKNMYGKRVRLSDESLERDLFS
jgi:hypothetical protein